MRSDELGHPHPLPRAVDIGGREVGSPAGVELQPLRDDPPNQKVVEGPTTLFGELGQRPADLQLRGAEHNQHTHDQRHLAGIVEK